MGKGNQPQTERNSLVETNKTTNKTKINNTSKKNAYIGTKDRVTNLEKVARVS